jgi:hypothetical protein
MSVINLISAPANGANVFSPMVFEFNFSAASCSFLDLEGNAAIDVSLNYAPLIEVGANIRIANGAYLGVYRVTSVTPDTALRLTLDTPFIGTSAATGSTKFTPEGVTVFQLIAGYSEGPEAAIKPWQVTDEIRVSPNLNGVFRFDVAGFLRSRFSITAPVAGPNVPISLRYDVRLKTIADIPNDANARTAYYGLEPLSLTQQEGDEVVGERPILFFGGVPTLYSLALGKGVIHNFVADPDAPGENFAGATVDVRLLSCEPKAFTWVGASPTAGFTTSPALPSWLQATANGNNIEVVINPCTAGVGDYLSGDYNPLDYLVAGEVNSVTGCYSFAFALGGNALFTLGVCVTPISEVVEVCTADSLIFGWLNERGGFSSMAVEGRYVNGREFGGDTLAVDANQVLKRVQFRDVYDTTEIRGGVVSKNQLDLLSSLRSSIQVYLYSPATQAFDIPVVLDRASFGTYGNKFNQSETRYGFKFRRAKRLTVQTQ